MIATIDKEQFEYEPYKDDLYRERMILRMRESPSYKLVFKVDKTEKFYNIIRQTVDPDYQFTQNILLSISGQTGSSKSWSTISLGQHLFPHFSAKNIFFYDQDIIDNVHNFPANTLLIRDENTAKGEFGVGSNRSSFQFTRLYETARASGLNVAMIEPDFAPNPIVKYFLSTVDIDFKNRINRLALMESESYRFLGAVFVKILPDKHPTILEYEKKKADFIEQIKTGETKGKANYKQIAQDTLADPDFLDYKNKAEKKAYLIMKNPSLTTGEIEIILSLINVALRIGDLDAGKKVKD